MTAERLRAFVALPVPEVVKVRLREVHAELQRALPGGALRYTRPEQFHLTLAFLGDIASWQAEAVRKLLYRVAAERTPIELATAALGTFPSPRRPSVLWLGLAGDLDELYGLHDHLHTGLIGLDLLERSNNFHPHLTLARVKRLSSALRGSVAELLDKGALGAPVSWRAERVQLVSSRLESQGASYSVMEEALLGGGRG